MIAYGFKLSVLWFFYFDNTMLVLTITIPLPYSFQKEYEALEQEGMEEKQQLAAIHQQHVH